MNCQDYSKLLVLVVYCSKLPKNLVLPKKGTNFVSLIIWGHIGDSDVHQLHWSFYTFLFINFWEGSFTHINGIIGINVVNYWGWDHGIWACGLWGERLLCVRVVSTLPLLSLNWWCVRLESGSSPLSISLFTWFKFYSFHLKFLNNMVVGIILDKKMAFVNE